ncbi:MAG: Rieske 2Fe-2S domain-containing protein [Chitinivibrionales bacterium]|nr:Rieske 2Fe-2S domain-containing protein [Chitinivibrionales bacterium]
MHDKQLPRRTFLRNSGAALLVTGSVGFFAGCTNGDDDSNPAGGSSAGIDISEQQYQALQTVGNGVVTTYNDREIALYRKSESEIVALSAVCTHQGCIVESPANGTIDCLCHGSQFNAETGAVIQGPASTSLQQYTATLTGNQLVIDLN